MALIDLAGFVRQKSTEKGAQANVKAISIQFFFDFCAIFVVFRGRFARASRCAARWAEPLFLLTGAVLQRVRTLCENAKTRQNATTNRNAVAFRARRADRTRNFPFRRQLGTEVGRFGALPTAPGRLYWRPWTHRAALGGRLGLARGDPTALRGAPGTSLGRPRWLERVPRSMLGDSGLMLRQFLVRFSSLFEVASHERVDVLRVRNDERQRERLDLVGSIGQRLDKLHRIGNDRSI